MRVDSVGNVWRGKLKVISPKTAFRSAGVGIERDGEDSCGYEEEIGRGG